MPTNAELSEKLKEKNAEIEVLEKRIEQLETELQLQAAKKPAAMAGWLVTAKNKRYSGVTSGIQFRNGRAFVPDKEKYHAIIRDMEGDFGYTVRKVDDINNLDPEETDQIEKTLSESLLLPEYR